MLVHVIGDLCQVKVIAESLPAASMVTSKFL